MRKAGGPSVNRDRVREALAPRALTAALMDLERELGREINAAVFTPGELRDRVRNGDPFARAVLAGPKVFLEGDDDALARIVG